jgi:predicted transporter
MTDSPPAQEADQAAPTPATPATAVKEYPGQTLGVVALVLSFFLQIPALIMGIIAWNWSNRAGVANTPAKVSVFVSIGLIVLGILALVGWVILLASVGSLIDESFFENL